MFKTTKKVETFLGQDPVPMFIGGNWAKSSKDVAIRVENPANQNLLTNVSMANADDTRSAIEAAEKAFASWKNTKPQERAELLEKFADLLERDAEELAQLEALDVGKPFEIARDFDVAFGLQSLRYYAGLLREEKFERQLNADGIDGRSVQLPFGVVGFIFPWNFPLTLCMWGIGPALAAGNTVVVKPAELTPLSTLYLGLLAKEAGIPDGVFNVIPADGSIAGDVLTSDPRVKCVSFTGSPEVGRIVGKNCGQNLKPVKLELGGKGAAVVFDDADLASTAEALANAITLNTGQVCCTATRWIVQESVVQELTDMVKSNLEKTVIGSGMTGDIQMGPLVSQKQKDSVLNYIKKGEEEGATIVTGGKPMSGEEYEKGHFVEPTLLAGGEDNICFKEEVFGPVAYVTSFKDENDAVRQVNSLDYGLANSVWTADKQRANRVANEMISGNSWINAHNVFAYGLPYGGVNKSGYGGGVNSVETLFDFTRSLSIAEPA